MTDTPGTDTPAPAPAAPYGPADEFENLFASAANKSAPDAHAARAIGVRVPQGDAASVTRARRKLKLLAIASTLTGLALSDVALIVQIVTGVGFFSRTAMNDVAGSQVWLLGVVFAAARGELMDGPVASGPPVHEFIGLILGYIGLGLLVLGLNMLVWRAVMRPLARRSPGSRIGAIIRIGVVASFVSVILVIILVFLYVMFIFWTEGLGFTS